mmetsp:Transcript_34317/g.107548  ORF Transcript_34317/g.107548 Transcript_34317/m.107548 type:complete len:269 (-) Transcript_34317:220-1026(-)
MDLSQGGGGDGNLIEAQEDVGGGAAELAHDDGLHLSEGMVGGSVCEHSQHFHVGLGDPLVSCSSLQRRHELSRLGVETPVGPREVQALARRPLVHLAHHLLALLLSLRQVFHAPHVVLPDLLEEVVRPHAPVDPQPDIRLVPSRAPSPSVRLVEHGGDAKATDYGDGGADVSEPLPHGQRASALPALAVAVLLRALFSLLRRNQIERRRRGAGGLVQQLHRVALDHGVASCSFRLVRSSISPPPQARIQHFPRLEGQPCQQDQRRPAS